jgi:ATP-dependent RNA helicase SUPV3L1/SUV3
MQIRTRAVRKIAVLGPTNTGKTHLALERMLGHASGMIGFPLRLLARENYDRAARVKPKGQIALITGEEKIVPPGAKYFLCTVEAMPLGRSVSFLGIDEVQMCADPDRGHVFTDRLLNARGEHETMFMGADTIRPMMRKLLPDVEFLSRPRFSTLRYAGERKVTRLPPRSAVVAFSAADVYAIAELLRRQRGGAAVVLGALSPRTRNAQVAMYQAGEVDYMVATDAIGMGLNMDVEHVAFAGTRKFDGRGPRLLTPAELGQIAGRSGRHMNDGTFGTTGDIGPLDPEAVERIENHHFEPLRSLFWRNDTLRFTSVDALIASLAERPPGRELIRAREAEDERTLGDLVRDPNIAKRAKGTEAVRLLWEVCRIPDFGKTATDGHTRLLSRIFRHLAGSDGDGRLPTDWVAAHVSRIDRTDGDIETLAQRIANIRTWTYVSYRGEWLDDAEHWRERTRAVEDRLSDALHARLTQRFVDRRTSVLVRRMKDRDPLAAAVDTTGDVHVEGEFVGRIEGFQFLPDPDAGDGLAGRAVRNAARQALGTEITKRLRRLESATPETFSLDETGRITWEGNTVARLVAGADILQPALEALVNGVADSQMRERIRKRAATWFEGYLADRLAPLFRIRDATISGSARGIAYQIVESLGSMPRRHVARLIDALGRDDRKVLRALDVRLGRESVFVPALVRPGAVETRALLWRVHANAKGPAPPPAGRVTVPVGDGVPMNFYESIGYRPLGPVAVRVDMLERLAARAWTLSQKGPFAAAPELLSNAGCGIDEMAGILIALGYREERLDGDRRFVRASRRKPGVRRKHGQRRVPKLESPFQSLRALNPGK